MESFRHNSIRTVDDEFFRTRLREGILTHSQQPPEKRQKVPHPFPYQGSKRAIAPKILRFFPKYIDCLIEPFCGSSAVSIAAACQGLANSFRLNDINRPLMDLWQEILHNPAELVDRYERLWLDQQVDKTKFFLKIRKEFNATSQSHHLLYLLARIVKGSVRYSSSGMFNQSPDNRRLGMKPSTMRKQILGISALLGSNTDISAVDYRDVVATAQPQDLVYMDPPYQGISQKRDHRYYNGLDFSEFTASLEEMNNARISYIVSYDGWTGSKKHGHVLPPELCLTHLLIHAGRSTQATFLGKSRQTVESLYLSPVLTERLGWN